MQTVVSLLNKLSNLSITDVIFDALVETEEDYIRQQKQQMLEGINSEGGRIGTYANPAYKAEKLRQNPLAEGYVDLRRKGPFQDHIFAITDNIGYRVGSTDTKSVDLQKKYKNIFTLAPVNKQTFIRAKLYPTTLIILIKHLS